MHSLFMSIKNYTYVRECHMHVCFLHICSLLSHVHAQAVYGNSEIVSKFMFARVGSSYSIYSVCVCANQRLLRFQRPMVSLWTLRDTDTDTNLDERRWGLQRTQDALVERSNFL